MSTTDDRAPVTGLDITVMVCAHNAATTINEALASIAGQTHRPGAVLVIDDASEDATATVAASWAELIPVEVVSLPTNLGVSNARREAVQRVRTPLVTILDADDVWLPDHLETLLRTYERQPGLVASQPLEWLPGVGVASSTPEIYQAAPPAEQCLHAILERNIVFSGALFSRADYEQAGGYRATLRRSEDWDLWIRMVRAGVSFTTTGHPTVLYRISPTSLSFGFQTAEADLEVMELALTDAASDDERRWTTQLVHRRRARLALTRAFNEAREGHPSSARRAAIHALHGNRRVALQAVAMLVAPKRAIERRDGRTADVGRRIN